MSPPARQSVARISEESGIPICTLYAWRKCWRLEGEVVPASQKEPEGWSAADKFTVVLETAGLNATELSVYCRERGLYPEQVERWRQASQDANEKPVLTLKEQRELEKLRAQDQREIRRLQKELRKKEKALAEAAALLLVTKNRQGRHPHRQQKHESLLSLGCQITRWPPTFQEGGCSDAENLLEVQPRQKTWRWVADDDRPGDGCFISVVL